MAIGEMERKMKEATERMENHEKRLQGLSGALDSQRESMHETRAQIQRVQEGSRLDNERIKCSMVQQNERMNTIEIRQNKIMYITVDGIAEGDGVDPILSFITKFNNDTEAGLVAGDIKSAWRVGKSIENREKFERSGGKTTPRPVSMILASEGARDKIMSNRSKLKKNDDGSYLWINEEQPEVYKRRKTMLRDLVKLARKKGFKDAKIEAGGVKVGGILYTADRLDELPEAIRPERVRIRHTKNKGLAFFSEWAYLSNMYSTRFVCNDKVYISRAMLSVGESSFPQEVGPR